MAGKAGLGGTILEGGAKIASKGWAGLKKLFGFGAAGAGGAATGFLGQTAANAIQGANQQSDSGETELPTAEVEATPNVTPMQQLNTAASSLISPISPGGTPDEKLDYLINANDSLRRSVNGLNAAVRNLSMGLGTVNKNVSAVATKPQSMFRRSLGAATRQGAYGGLLAVGAGAAAALIAGGAGLFSGGGTEGAQSGGEELIGDKMVSVIQGNTTLENSGIIEAVNAEVAKLSPEAQQGTIEDAIKENPQLGATIQTLQQVGIPVDVNDKVANINQYFEQLGVRGEEASQEEGILESIGNKFDELTGVEQPAPQIQQQSYVPSDNKRLFQNLLLNKDNKPTGAELVSEPAPDMRAKLNLDEAVVNPAFQQQAGLTQAANFINPTDQDVSAKTFAIAKESEKKAVASQVTAPIVVNNYNGGGGNNRVPTRSDTGATLVVAYRTPADSRSYSIDNYTSV